MKRILALIWLALVGFYIAWPAWTGYKIRQAFETEDAALLESKVDFDGVRASLKPVIAAEADAYFERLKRDVGPLGGLLSGQIKGELTGRLVETAVNSAITPPNVIRMVRDGKSVKQSLEKVMVEQAGAGGGLKLPGFGGARGPKAGSVDPANNDPGRGVGNASGSTGSVPEAKQASAGGVNSPFKEVDRQTPAGAAGGVGQASGPQPDMRQGETRQPRPRLGLANIKSFSIDGPLGFTVGVAKDANATEPELTATLRFTGGDWKVVSVTPDFAGRRANRQ